MSRVSHVTHVHESCQGESWHTNTWVTACRSGCRVCQRWVWVMSHMSHVSMRHVTNVNYQCRIRECIMSYHFLPKSNCSILRVSGVNYMMTVLSRSLDMCDMTLSWHDSLTCVKWLIHMRNMTHSYVWHDSFIIVTWLIHMWDMTHSYV